MERPLHLNVNGKAVDISSDPTRPLLEILREDLGLTGTKYGCGEGECGACTVVIGGEAVRSCITSVADVEGLEIQTIESLAAGGQLHPVQQAFLDQQAMQCGYCVPGQIMTVVALLQQNEHPTRQEIIEAMDGNICRCCNYRNILSAVSQAAGRTEEGQP